MKSQNKKTFVVREGGGKYSLLATACLLALASIANAQEIVSYGQSIDDKQYGIAFDSSVGHSTISGKTIIRQEIPLMSRGIFLGTQNAMLASEIIIPKEMITGVSLLILKLILVMIRLILKFKLT